MVDGDAGELGQQDERLLVVLGELAAALLVAQIQVAIGHVADADRDPQERRHRRVPGREAIGVRVRADIGQAQRLRVGDELPEHAAAGRQRADPRPGLLVDARRHEAHQGGPGLGEHPDRRIAGARKLARGREHALEDGLEIEIAEHPASEAEHAVWLPVQPSSRDVGYYR